MREGRWVTAYIRERESFGAYNALLSELATDEVTGCVSKLLYQRSVKQVRTSGCFKKVHLASTSETQRTCHKPASSILSATGFSTRKSRQLVADTSEPVRNLFTSMC